MCDKKKELTGEELKEVSGGLFKKEKPTTFTCANCGRFIDLQGRHDIYEKYKENRFWCNLCGAAPPLPTHLGPGSGIE